MSKGFLYYYKRTFINRLKNFKRKPLKSIGMIFLVLYFIMLPFFFKGAIEVFSLNNAKGYIAIYTVVAIFLGMPSTLSYLKRKGLIFKEADINFIFSGPTSPKSIIVYGMAKNLLVYIVEYIIYFIAAVFIFNIPLLKALIIAITGLVFSNLIQISLAVIMYGNESLTHKGKNIIKYLVFGILLVIMTLLAYKLLQEGLSVKNVMNFLTGDLILIIPIFGWEIGFLKLVLIGPSTFNIIASVLYFTSALVLFIIAKKMKSTGEFYEDATSFAEEYEKAIEKSKDGGFHIVGGKTKARKIDFSTKGKLSKAIFYKQVDEFKKISLLSRYGKAIIFLAISVIFGIIFKMEDAEIDVKTMAIVIYGASVYMAIFFSKMNSWRKEFDNYYIYLIPDTRRNKVFYATLLQNIKNLIQGLALVLPINIIFGLPLYLIPLNAILYFMVHATILYVDLILREVLGGKIGKTITEFIMLGVDMLVLVLGGFLLGLFISITENIFVVYLVVLAFLFIMSFIGLSLSSKLYGNMEFVNEE